MKAKVFLVSKGRKVELEDPFVCIHVKGYSLARVTHLDIEHERLDNLIPPKRGGLHRIEGVKGGIEIVLKRKKEIEYKGSRLKPERILVRCPTLNQILGPGRGTLTWVGGKFGGIYVGFRKPEIERMELIAKDEFKVRPR